VNSPPTFVIVDDVDENRVLLSRTLRRKFPHSAIVECFDSPAALAVLEQRKPTVIIVHRGFDVTGPQMIRLLRKQDARVPIIMVSSRESCPEAIEAGANAFLNYDAWLRIGTIVEVVMAPGYVGVLTTAPSAPERGSIGWRPGSERQPAD
jgi:CheY-like chemotaxis protein